MINRDKELAAQALSMFQEEDLCHFSNEHERVVIDAIRAYIGWQTMETMPIDMWVLCASSNGLTVEIVKMIPEQCGEKRFYDEPPLIAERYYRDGTFTHWMPLPEMPEAKDD